MMKAVESYEALAPLLTAQLRPGVATNAGQGAEDYRREIAAGTLFYEERPGLLLLFRRRPGFWRLSFYAQRGAVLEPLSLPEPVMLEAAFRPRDKALQEAVARWQQAGFCLLFRRRRLLRPAGEPALEGNNRAVKLCALTDVSKVESILTACFDPPTACLPTREELLEDAEAGRLFLAEGGVLHVSAAAGGTQLRHLAVLPGFRRRGVAQALFHAYVEKYGSQPSRCWVRVDNAPACRFYQKNGYQTEEWASVVCSTRKDVCT